MADENPSWVAQTESAPPPVYLTTQLASAPWEAQSSRFHRYLLWSGFAVAGLVLAWAVWSVHASL